jgi:hypothetical protein
VPTLFPKRVISDKDGSTTKQLPIFALLIRAILGGNEWKGYFTFCTVLNIISFWANYYSMLPHNRTSAQHFAFAI